MIQIKESCGQLYGAVIDLDDDFDALNLKELVKEGEVIILVNSLDDLGGCPNLTFFKDNVEMVP